MKVTRFVTDFDPGADTPAGAVGPGTIISAGDLTGTHAVPKVAGIGGATISGTPAAGEAVVATSSTAASWQAIIVDPTTTEGDTLYRHSGAVSRLAVGAAGTILSSNGTDPSWGSGPMTTEGDVIYQHSGVPTRLAVGGANTVVHGGTDPAYSAVVEADITLANNTTNDVSITKHGFAPIAPNDATKFLNGQGAYTVPSGGGGGIAQSFTGYNTIGGSWLTLTNLRWYTKQITLGSDSTFTSIDIYLRVNTDDYQGSYAISVLKDNAGSPGELLGLNSVQDPYLSVSGTTPGPGEWRSIPMGCHLSAGTYWIGFQPFNGGGNAARIDMAYDGSGSDVYWTTVTFPYLMGAYPTGGGSYVPTVTSSKYSIRASILS